MEMAAPTRLGPWVILSFCTISVIADMKNACSSPSGFLPSNSCSSYFYCDWLGNPQEGECEEGKFWNKDSELCDLEENVSCGKGLFRSGSVVKAGLQLASIAGVSLANLLGSSATTNIEKENENEQTFITEIFGTETKAYPLDSTNINYIEEENVQDVITGRFGTLPLKEKEGPGSSFLYDDTEYDYKTEAYETTPAFTISRAKQLFLQKNDDNLPKIINEVLEQREEITPTPLTISGAKQLFLRKNDDNLPRIINRVLEQRKEITPPLTISGAKQLFLRKNDDNLPRIINRVLEQREEITPPLTISGAK